MVRMSEHNEEQRYIGDVGAPFNGPREEAAVGFGMVVLALAVGFAVGFAVWAVFKLSGFLTGLLWEDGYAALAGMLASAGLSSWWIPLAFCSLGGLVIGLWTWRFGGAPQPMEQVLGQVRQTGGYRLDKPLASIVGFLLPLVFGGSIGPEAGLTGIIAAACTKVGELLKAAGLRVKGVADLTVSAALSAIFATPFAGVVTTAQDAMPSDSGADGVEYRRTAKLVLYTASALGAVAGVMALTSLLGAGGAGLPRFEGMVPGANKLWWALPCLLAGYAGTLVYHGGQCLFGRASSLMGGRPVLKPLVAGVVLGLLAIPLPLVLFPGEEQSFELMESWQSISALVLIATGLLKCAATPLCLRFGWGGGHFFPVIFAGVALGYGIASLAGIEPMFCVAVTTAALVAGVQRKPLIAVGLLLMCFPASGIVWMGIACVLGASLPVPAALLKH